MGNNKTTIILQSKSAEEKYMFIKSKSLIVLALTLGILVAGVPCFSETINYVYDTMGRLIQVKYADGTVIQYTYDKLGNRLQQTVGQMVFSDIPSGYWAESYILPIYTAGITKGCSQAPLKYCPEDNVTRGQMAAFIIRSKYGENFACTGTPYFSDVPTTNVFFNYVQKLKDDGITALSGVYGVDNNVTRGQVAAFITRAKYGENFTYTQAPYFSDVPAGHTFFKYVQKLRDDHITAVIGTYDVDGIVTRAQMAAFLARGFLGMQ